MITVAQIVIYDSVIPSISSLDYLSSSTEDCLIKRLTKINRMDIVHLIETQKNKSIQEQTSRTYAEIERTLDHSEGINTSKL